MFIVVFRKGPRDKTGRLGKEDKLVWATAITIKRDEEGQHVICHQHDVTEYSDATGPTYLIPNDLKADSYIHFYIKDIRTGKTISPWPGKVWGCEERP
jgi:hypothetical protein